MATNHRAHYDASPHLSAEHLSGERISADDTTDAAERQTVPAIDLRRDTAYMQPTHADAHHDGTGQIVVGATLTGLGAISGVFSVLTGIQATQSDNETRSTANLTHTNGDSRPSQDLEVKAGAQRDGVENSGRSSPTNAAEYRRLSLGLALGAGVLLSAGGLLIYRGILARRPVELHIKPVLGKRRTLVHLRAKF